MLGLGSGWFPGVCRDGGSGSPGSCGTSDYEPTGCEVFVHPCAAGAENAPIVQ